MSGTGYDPSRGLPGPPGPAGSFEALESVDALRLLVPSDPDAVVALSAYNVDGTGYGSQGIFQADFDATGVDDGVTRFTATGFGTAGIGWRRVFSGQLDPRWGGVLGDGVADDSLPMQRVIDAANALGIGIEIPSITILASGLVSNAPLTISGLSREDSVLKKPNHNTDDILTTDFSLVLENLTFDGNKANQTVAATPERTACVRFDGTTASLSVNGCNFINTTACAIIAPVVEKEFYISDSLFKNQADANGVTLSYPNVAVAVLASTGETGTITVVNNSFIQDVPTLGVLAPAGIEVNGTAPGTVGNAAGLSVAISDNFFYGLGNESPGIGNIDLYDYVGKSTIIGNRIWNRTGGGIKFANAAATTCIGNSINGQAYAFNVAAIYYSGAVHALPELPFPDVVISNNVIKDCSASYGIHLVGDGGSATDGGPLDLHVRGIVCNGNSIDTCLTGIFCDGIADSSLSGNVIRNQTATSFSDGGVVFYRCCGDITVEGGEILNSANPGIYTYADQLALRLKVQGVTFRNSNGVYQLRVLALERLDGYSNIFRGTSPTILAAGGGLTPVVRLIDNQHDLGTLSAVAKSSTGPTVTATGIPKADDSLVVTITTAGALGVGQFKWSKNGVDQETGVTLTGTYQLGSTGVTVTFPAGTYVLNETYTMTTARVTGLISVTVNNASGFTTTDYIHRGNSWDTIYGNGSLITVTILAGTETAYNLYPWGVDPGDLVTLACDKDLQGIIAMGEVTANNGVKARLLNPTPGDITLTDARFQCETHKRVNPSFTPDDMAALTKLWLRADYGVVKDGGNLVERWNDSSRNNYYPARQATAANKPIWVANVYNGYPTIRGNDGTDGLALQVALNIGTTQFVLWAMKVSTVAAYEWATSGGNGVFSKVSGNLTEWANGADRYTFANNPIGLHIYGISQNDAGGAGSLIMYLDGAVVQTQAATVAFPDIINIFGRGIAAGGTNGDIPEFIAIAGIPTAGEIKSLTRYLGAKYNVVVA